MVGGFTDNKLVGGPLNLQLPQCLSLFCTMLSARLYQERYVLNGVVRPIAFCLTRAEAQASVVGESPIYSIFQLKKGL